MEEQRTVVCLCFYVWTLLDYHVWKCVRFCGRVGVRLNKHVFTKIFDEISFVCEPLSVNVNVCWACLCLCGR